MVVCLLVFAWGTGIFPSESFFAFGQNPAALDISVLSSPPKVIADLIEIGDVRFEEGDRDPELEPTDGPRISAETRYRIAYQFRSHAKWSLRRGRLTVRVRFHHVNWKPTHVIWFRKSPMQDNFWNQPLLRHEFDHVQISSDPKLEKLFAKRLEEASIIQKTLDDGETVNDAMIDELVESTVAKVFSDISELIAIRYKELDRVTNHGLRPLPSDFSMQVDTSSLSD